MSSLRDHGENQNCFEAWLQFGSWHSLRKTPDDKQDADPYITKDVRRVVKELCNWTLYHVGDLGRAPNRISRSHRVVPALGSLLRPPSDLLGSIRFEGLDEIGSNHRLSFEYHIERTNETATRIIASKIGDTYFCGGRHYRPLACPATHPAKQYLQRDRRGVMALPHLRRRDYLD